MRWEISEVTEKTLQHGATEKRRRTEACHAARCSRSPANRRPEVGPRNAGLRHERRSLRGALLENHRDDRMVVRAVAILHDLAGGFPSIREIEEQVIQHEVILVGRLGT